jgi:hypothetical protein
MALSKEQAHFKAVAPKWMHKLLLDFPMLDVTDAAAVFGNLGHESKGLTDDQEDKPVVKGSRGGLNWGQWTGPRRRAFEAYCNRNNLDANSDEAAYAWLFLELKGEEKKAIPALVKAQTLKDKVIAFEKAFLRAGVKHYPSRTAWAELWAYTAAYSGDRPEPEQVPGKGEIPAVPPAAPAQPTKQGAPGWVPGLVILALSALVGLVVWLNGGIELPTQELSLLGGPTLGDAPVPHDRPLAFGGFSEIGWQALLIPILLSFTQPLVAAAAAWMVAQITYWWMKLLKSNFDEAAAAKLHTALENAITAGIEQFGTGVRRGKLQAFASDYVQTYNPGAVKKFKLSDGELQELALPHIARLRKAL